MITYSNLFVYRDYSLQCPSCWGGTALVKGKIGIAAADPSCPAHLPSKPYEVWVSETLVGEPGLVTNFRFNANFSARNRALDEVEWYKRHGYSAHLLMAPRR